MMDKKGFIVVLFLLLSVLVAVDSYAQQGCCVYNSGSSSLTCKDGMTQTQCSGAPGTTYRWEAGPLTCATLPDKACTLACKICVPISGNTGARYIWGLPANGCEQFSNTLKYNGNEPSRNSESLCNSPGTPSTVTLPNVTGIVRDKDVTGTPPVADALVGCNGASDRTDSNGNYRLVGCSIGSNQIITAVKGSKTGTSQPINLLAGVEHTANIDITAVSTKQIEITVLNESNNVPLIADITIITNASGLPELKSTNAQGKATFIVKPQFVTISVSKMGYVPASGTGLVSFESSAKTTQIVVLRKVPTIQLTGYVLDGPTQPRVGQASIGVYVNNVLFGSTTSNAQGFYSLIVPSTTQLKITVSANTFQARTIEPLTFNQNQELNITLQKILGVRLFKVNITVVNGDKSNQPIQGVNVCQGQSCDIYKTTNPQGKVDFGNLLEGQTYTFYAYHDEFSLQNNYKSIFVDANKQETIVLSEAPRMTITGKIVDGETGEGVEGARVTLSDGSSAVTSSAFGSEGVFTINRRITPQIVTLFASANNYLPNSDITIQPGGQENRIDNLGNIQLFKTECSSPENVGDITLTTAQDQDLATLTWNVPCLEKTNGEVQIMRGIDGAPLSTYKVEQALSSPFTDSGLESETTYCYNITTSYNFEQPTGIVKKSSLQSCVTVGPSVCFDDPERQFCDPSGVRTRCINSGNNTEPIPCSQGEACLEFGNSAICLPANYCDYCNRPFGVFSYPAQQSDSVFGAKYHFGTPATQSFTPFVCTQGLGDQGAVACYLDASKTIVDKYNSCQNVDSCYDYATEDACSTNKCTPTQACTWERSSYDELGIGVCRPSEPSEQNCNEFSNSHSRLPGGIYNKVFASERGDVARELCSLYADSDVNRCYYKENPLGCLNQNETSCYDYEDQVSCIGSSNTAINVNVTWAKIGNNLYDSKRRGDNKILAESDDLQDVGRCRWIESGQNSKCVKDSDNATGFNEQYGANKEDCLNIFDPTERQRCALDKSSPETFFVYPDITNEVNFEYSAVDDNSILGDSKYKIKLYALAINPSTININTYPLDVYPNLQNQPGVLNLGQKATGNDVPFTLLYFSEDYAHNLERVRRINFTIDTVNPGINFTYAVKPDIINNKVDLYVTLKLDKDTSGYCARDLISTGLFLEDSVLPELPNLTSLGKTSSSSNGNPATWSEVYRNIPTGENGTTAEYVWNCYDKAGNPALEPQSATLALDADGTISDPTINAFQIRDVPISIKTLYPGECRYTDNDPENSQIAQPYSSWTSFSSTGDQATYISNEGKYLHEAAVSVPPNIYKKRFKVQCNLTGLYELVMGRNGDDIKLTIDDIKPTTQPHIRLQNGQRVNITLTQVQQYWTNGQAPFLKLECGDFYQNSEYPRESGCGTIHFCDGDGLNLDCNIEDASADTLASTYQPSFTKSTSIKYMSVDKFGNAENVQPRNIYFDNIPPVVELNYPLNETIYRTKDSAVSLGGIIRNIGNLNEISPLRSIYYKLEYRTSPTSLVLDKNETLNPLSESSGGESRLGITSAEGTITDKTVLLVPNKVNILTVFVTDFANNEGEPIPNGIAIVQDSLGPNISAATINGRPVTATHNVTFGTDYTLTIRNLLDRYPNTAEFANPILGLQDRVVSVVVEDMFGTKHNLDKIVTGQGIEWTTELQTRGWPITSPEFPTFIKIIATDSLGKREERTVNIKVVDVLPPWVDYTLENNYGELVTELVPGNNFVVARASEPLKNLDMKFDVTQLRYTTQFFAHDFDAKTWTGIVDVTTNISPALTNGTITDLNNLISSDFRPSGDVSVRTYLVAEPLPFTSLGIINGVYYSSTRDVPYLGIDETTYDYQFSINGKINTSLPIGNSITGLINGLNDISLRVEDKNNKFYKVFSQKIFVDTSAPIITSYPSRTFTSSNNLWVDFTEFGSGIYNETTRLVITNSAGDIVATVRLSNANLRRIPVPSLPAGTYFGNAQIFDLAGNANEPIQEFSFRINPSAPALTLTSADLTNIGSYYYTNKQNPAITVSFSSAVSDPTARLIQGASSTPLTLTSAAANSYTVTGIDLTSNSQYILEVKVGDDFWLYPIIKDSTPPQFIVMTSEYTNGNPLVANAIVTDGEKQFSQGTLLFDNSAKQQLNDISAEDGVFTFSANLGAVNPGPHQASIILKDRLGQETRIDSTVTIDVTAPVITTSISLTDVENLSGVFTTKEQDLALSGAYSDDDTTEIYVVGRDGARYDAAIDRTNKQYLIPGIRLIGTTFTETRNDMTLYFKDRAGNFAQKVITIVKDLKPPDLVELLFLRVFG